MEQEFGRFLGPTTLRSSVDLSLSMSADTSHEPSEGNDFGLVQNILQVGCSTVQGHLFDGLGCLSGVLYGGKKYIKFLVFYIFSNYKVGEIKINDPAFTE